MIKVFTEEMKGMYYTSLPACLNCKFWVRCEVKRSFGWCQNGLMGSIKCSEFTQNLATYYTNICDEWVEGGQ